MKDLFFSLHNICLSIHLKMLKLSRPYRILVFPKFAMPDHALTKPASTIHNKKILLILNILLIQYYSVSEASP